MVRVLFSLSAGASLETVGRGDTGISSDGWDSTEELLTGFQEIRSSVETFEVRSSLISVCVCVYVCVLQPLLISKFQG